MKPARAIAGRTAKRSTAGLAVVCAACSALASAVLAIGGSAAPPPLDASPRQLQFGVQPINTQTTLTVTITNTSTELIRFAGGSIGAQRHHDVNPFGEDLSQIDLNTCLAFVGHLPPGGTCTAPLTFTPPEPGNYHGRYRIEFFRPEFPDEHDTFAVSLSGRGIDN